MITDSVNVAKVWDIVDDPAATLHGMYDEVGGPLYASLCLEDRHEVSEYIAALRATTGPVLELAAGNGRLTFPMLAAGHQVVATEFSPTMLGLLKEKIAHAPSTVRKRIKTILADMRKFDLRQQFGAIVLGATSISLLDESGRGAMFAMVRKHLQKGGRFLVTTLDLSEQARNDVHSEHVLRDSSGPANLLAERVDSAGASREVVLAPLAPTDNGSVSFVCHSIVAVLTVEVLASEARAAGLMLESVVLCQGYEGRHRLYLLTFVVEEE